MDKGGRGASQRMVRKLIYARSSCLARLWGWHQRRGPFSMESLFIFIWQLTRIPSGTLTWVGSSLARDPACLTSVLTALLPSSGKALGQHSDCTASEPAWITTVKQKHKSSQVQIPKKETKTKNKAGAKPEAKEPRHGGELAATHRTLQKVTRVCWLSLHWKLC